MCAATIKFNGLGQCRQKQVISSTRHTAKTCAREQQEHLKECHMGYHTVQRFTGSYTLCKQINGHSSRFKQMHCPLLGLHSFLPTAMFNKNNYKKKSSCRELVQCIGQDCVSQGFSLQLSHSKNMQLRQAISQYHNHMPLSEGWLMR